MSSALEQMRNSGSGFYQGATQYSRFASDYQKTDEDNRDRDEGRGAFGNQRTSVPEAAEIQNRLRNANRYSHEKEFLSDSNNKRSITPNATTNNGLISNSNSQIINRVPYKPTGGYD